VTNYAYIEVQARKVFSEAEKKLDDLMKQSNELKQLLDEKDIEIKELKKMIASSGTYSHN
jgi:hypothetical protein